MKNIFRKGLALAFVAFCFNQTIAQNTLPSSGNVGIGTVNPSEKLQVTGSVRIDSALIVKDTVVLEKDVRMKEKLVVEQQVKLKNDLTISQDLKVNGKSKFDSTAVFNGKVKLTAIDTASNLNNMYFLLLKGNNVVEKKEITALLTEPILQPALCFQDQNGNVTSPKWFYGLNKIYSNCPNVNIGIGTDAPTYKLHVVGDGFFSNTLRVSGNVGIGTAPSSFSLLKVKNSNSGAGLEIDNSGNTTNYNKLLLLKYTNSSTEIIKVENSQTSFVPFLLEASGKMTISNSTQKIFQLNEDGLLRARRIRVDADIWADYVFDPTYKLKPLAEVEKYIYENKHLPEVPSEAEVTTDWVDLTEMNRILLQKVEELTLYIIEQQKEIELIKMQLGKQ